MRFVVVLVLAAVALLGGRSLTTGDAAPSRARVVEVVDGDTVKVRADGRRESVRLIGIDTPETYAGPECGGGQATAAMKRLVRRGDRVRLVPDPSQDERDRYDRLLAYVERDGRDLGRELVRQGWAEVYVHDAAFERLRSYRRAARAAEREDRGVHEDCGGSFDRPE